MVVPVGPLSLAVETEWKYRSVLFHPIGHVGDGQGCRGGLAGHVSLDKGRTQDHTER